MLASYGANLANLTSLVKLPAPVQAYVNTGFDRLAGATEYLESATGYSPTTLYSTAAAGILVLAAIPAVATRNKNKGAPAKSAKMSRYGSLTRDGLSPFGSSLGDGTIPAITDDDYSYITSEDLQNQRYDVPRAHAHAHRAYDAEPIARTAHVRTPEDDIMLIKHRDVTYPEHFPAYSIGDGKLLVADVMERVKWVLDLSDRDHKKIHLFYKGRHIRDHELPVREYGVKNNSQVMVVLGDNPPDSSGDSSEEIVVVEPPREERERPKKSRKSKKQRGRRQDDREPRESGSSILGLEVPVEDDRRRGTSRVRTQSPSNLSAVSGASAAAAVPGGPIDKLNSIAGHFNAKLLPLCLQFTAAPPSDRKKREDEHRRISETVMQQVILKLDEVDTGGEDTARARRREIVRHVQDVLKRMDETVKA